MLPITVHISAYTQIKLGKIYMYDFVQKNVRSVRKYNTTHKPSDNTQLVLYICVVRVLYDTR